jgi:hypothetical protein
MGRSSHRISEGVDLYLCVPLRVTTGGLHCSYYVASWTKFCPGSDNNHRVLGRPIIMRARRLSSMSDVGGPSTGWMRKGEEGCSIKTAM